MDGKNVNLQQDARLNSFEAFAGDWNVEGENLGGAPNDADSKVTGKVSYRWLDGKSFLICSWDRRSENTTFIGIGIIGKDLANENLVTDNYDNLGFHRIYIIENDGRRWKFLGKTERAVIVFNENGDEFTEDWEIKKDDFWQPLCHLKIKKV